MTTSGNGQSAITRGLASASIAEPPELNRPFSMRGLSSHSVAASREE